MLSQNEPSALLSDARLTIATLIQRPSTITTSNAFDEFSVLDQLIDVSNDVDRFEGGESRKFLNIAQLITASTCIYSRRVDALYKLINNFHSTQTKQDDTDDDNDGDDEENKSIPILEQQDSHDEKKVSIEKKKKIKDTERSFICQDLSKINYTDSTKSFFLDRTSLFDLKLFQRYLSSIKHKQFWINDSRPMFYELLFDRQLTEQSQSQHEQFVDDNDNDDDHQTVIHQSLPEQVQPSFQDNDIPLPIPIFDEPEMISNDQEKTIEHERIFSKVKSVRTRRKKPLTELDLNIFRQGLTQDQQTYFHSLKFKSSTTKTKIEQTQFFSQKKFSRKHFDELIKDEYSSMSIFTYPIITEQYFSIRERCLMKIEPIRSPPIPIADVLNNDEFTDQYSPIFIDDNREDVDIRLQTDMEQILDAAILNSNEEQEHNKVFLELRSSITTYMHKHEANDQINVDDLFQTLDNQYSLPLIFSQLLHLCASTQRYNLHSTTDEKLFLEKIH